MHHDFSNVIISHRGHLHEEAFSDEQIISIFREAEVGVSVRELCHKHAISDATFYIYGLPPFCKY
ncbi:transposase [Klebsiella variicola]|uniref:transposase n=1 Tax=Klebsiella variicola TaxID=244366 RepID=UPI00403904EB